MELACYPGMKDADDSGLTEVEVGAMEAASRGV